MGLTLLPLLFFPEKPEIQIFMCNLPIFQMLTTNLYFKKKKKKKHSQAKPSMRTLDTADGPSSSGTSALGLILLEVAKRSAVGLRHSGPIPVLLGSVIQGSGHPSPLKSGDDRTSLARLQSGLDGASECSTRSRWPWSPLSSA